MRKQFMSLLRGRRTRFFLLLLGGIILNGVILGWLARAVYWRVAEQRVQQAIAAIEKDDPVWRWDDLMRER